MKHWKFTLPDMLLVAAICAVVYLRDWQAWVFLSAVVIYIFIQFRRTQKNALSADADEFLIDRDDTSSAVAELDVDIDYRPLPNHFRIDEHFDTRYTDSLYEYRINGTEISSRLIALKTQDIGESKHFEVRDGVVLETDMRKMAAEDGTKVGIDLEEDRIKSLKESLEWQVMKANSWLGLRYFIIAKKLPPPEARRYLRQELERFKSGCAAFFKEAEKRGVEKDDNPNSVDGLKFAEGKAKPSDGEVRALLASVETLGITELEFSWRRKLVPVLEKLLGD